MVVVTTYDDSDTARLPATPEAPGVAREWIQSALARAGWPPGAVEDVMLAVDEAVQNAVEHGSEAHAPVEIELGLEDGDAEVRVRDRGRPGAPVPTGPPETPPDWSPRGRGRAIMAALADADWRAYDGGTEVRLHFTADDGDDMAADHSPLEDLIEGHLRRAREPLREAVLYERVHAEVPGLEPGELIAALERLATTGHLQMAVDDELPARDPQPFQPRSWWVLT
jgi:anti-sigma regulatory factor (Ser/Thr protein kinase)